MDSYPPDVAAKMRADLSRGAREAWAKREQNGLGTRANGVYNEGVAERISESVKKQWLEGAYDDRQNYMSGRTGSLHHNWRWGKGDYREILGQSLGAEGELTCYRCGAKDEKLDVHHIDENPENYLLSNLIVLCVPCHMSKHYSRQKTAFMAIGRTFSFEYSHILPWHPGKCQNLHGHSGKLEVKVRGRIEKSTGVVMDFGDLSAIVKLSVEYRLDHSFLNEILLNPTAENLLVWIWLRLEDAGLKGLDRIRFYETEKSFAELGKNDMLEAFGWDKVGGKWVFVPKEYSVDD